MEELAGLKDPHTNNPIPVEAHYAEEIYTGPHLGDAPEIVFLLDEGRCEVDAKVGEDRLFVEGSPLTGWTGTHTRGGVFIAHGPGVKQGVRVEKATVLDVVPTLLRFYGVPTQDGMDGRVLTEIFDENSPLPERQESRSAEDGMDEPQNLDEEEKALIEERLKKLGYIS
ncbi:MAG: hypothetical protein PVJ38_04595, partial [Candidatus Bathyarchaeota archaeon]|jgi:predicted AlkP superfamily phosphohydrolase/phosphomutase